MIQLTRLNGQGFVLNSDLIETLEATPDVVITLTNGHKYVVSESPAEVVQAVIEYKRQASCKYQPEGVDKHGL